MAAHTAPLPSRPVSGCAQEQGDSGAGFVCPGRCGPARTPGSARPVPPSAPATLMAFRLVGSRADGDIARELSPSCPSPPAGMPPDPGVPHRLCRATRQHAGLASVSAARCLVASHPDPMALLLVPSAGAGGSVLSPVEEAGAEMGPLRCTRLHGCFPGTPGRVTSL